MHDDTLSIEFSEEVLKKQDQGLKEKIRVEGDLVKVGMMPVWDLAFARPSILKVCANDEYILGL